MKKYLIGGVVGFFAMPLLAFLILLHTSGADLLHLINHVFNDAPQEKYREPANKFYTGYGLKAPFIDNYSYVDYLRSFLIYREEPVLDLEPEDFRSLCIQSFDEDSFELAVSLTPQAREILRQSFAEAGDQFHSSFADGGYGKRYFIETSNDFIIWFWVTGGGAHNYANAQENKPEEPDFILSVPLGQLDNFQFYLSNGITDALPTGCTSDVKPEQMPGWNSVVVPFWEK